MIKLGDKVKDTITDFEGTVIARTLYLNGCVRYGVQAKELKDGIPVDCVWLDEEQLEKVEVTEPDIPLKIQKEESTGGPGSIPSEISHP